MALRNPGNLPEVSTRERCQFHRDVAKRFREALVTKRFAARVFD
jgi:hypothetical protein